MGIRYNEKRERLEAVTFGEDFDDFKSRFVEHDNKTNLTLIEYYLPKKREYLYIVRIPVYRIYTLLQLGQYSELYFSWIYL